MQNGAERRTGWKARIAHELGEYAVNVVYLAFFFGAFTWYRRLVLAEYGISYLHYGVAVVEALILAKVIMIGDILGLARKLEEKPLMVPTLYNALVFSLWVIVFSLIEHMVVGLVRGEGLTGGVHELTRQGVDELLARGLVTFVAFIPFFAFREMEGVLGEGALRRLFFRPRTPTQPSPLGERTPAEQTSGKR
jgi:hypothetical protein